MELEKIEIPESLNGIDEIKNFLFAIANKINEVIDLANERVNE